jgi:hypothetical protein
VLHNAEHSVFTDRVLPGDHKLMELGHDRQLP